MSTTTTIITTLPANNTGDDSDIEALAESVGVLRR
jgi:hypothetical protein